MTNPYATLDFATLFEKLRAHIEQRYALTTTIGEVRDNNTGDFNGNDIIIDKDLKPEVALFVLFHLFGHCVQWNTSEELRNLGQANLTKPNPEEMARIETYEQDATRYGIELLSEMNVSDIAAWTAWLSDWWAADWHWLKHFYLTGERLKPESLIRYGQSNILTPKPIPPFTPQNFGSRWSF